jgi:hypothetical protein
MTPDIADNADLRTCVDCVCAAVADALERRRDLPADIRALLVSATAVLAVVSVHLEMREVDHGHGKRTP